MKSILLPVFFSIMSFSNTVRATQDLICPAYVNFDPTDTSGWTETKFRADYSNVRIASSGVVFCEYTPNNSPQLVYTKTGTHTCPDNISTSPANGTFATPTSMSASGTGLKLDSSDFPLLYVKRETSSGSSKCYYETTNAHAVMSTSTYTSCTFEVSRRTAHCN